MWWRKPQKKTGLCQKVKRVDIKSIKMKKNILSIVLFLTGASGFSATTTISNSGTTFTPNAITINLGDDVSFSITISHNAIEVSKATYDANKNTALPGGFSVDFGGGTVSADKLTEGVHYYVCSPHASIGMKGTINVAGTTGIAVKTSSSEISIFPNPSDGNFQLKINNASSIQKFDLEIYSLIGAKVYSKKDLQQQGTSNIEAADLPKGTYVLKLYDSKSKEYLCS